MFVTVVVIRRFSALESPVNAAICDGLAPDFGPAPVETSKDHVKSEGMIRYLVRGCKNSPELLFPPSFCPRNRLHCAHDFY